MPDTHSSRLVQVWGTAPETGAVSFFHDSAGYLIRVHGIADFRMSADGAELRCDPLPDALAPWEPVFRQQVLPLQRAQQGQPVFHGGAVCRGDHAVVLLGPSGQGKSTLTAACASSGMAFLTDDCLMLREGTPVTVLPDEDHVRVWADSYAALGGTAPDEEPSGWLKPRLQADAVSLPHRSEPARLACMIVLAGESEDVVLERLSPADATMSWRSNAFVVDLRAPQVLRDTMQRAARLAQAVPAYRLKYPRRYARLPEVVAAVSACLDAAVAGKAT